MQAWTRLAVGTVFLVTLLMASVEASSPKAPLEFRFGSRDEPAVGQRFQIVVDVSANHAYGDDRLVLRASPSLRIEGDASRTIDTSRRDLELTWYAVVQSPGPWIVFVHYQGGMSRGNASGCCLYGVSAPDEGRASPEPADLFTDVGVKSHSKAWLESANETARVRFTVEPRGRFLAFGEGHLAATSSGHPGGASVPLRGSQAQTVEAHAPLEMGGGFAFTLQAEWRIRFPPADPAQSEGPEWSKSLVCRWHYVKRSEALGFKEEAVECGASSPWFIPGPSPLSIVAMVAFAGGVAMRRRC